MPDGLNLAANLTLPPEAVTQTFALLARRGAGKTYCASVMAEEMLAAGRVIVWLDPIGVAWGLRSQFPILILGGERGDIPLDPHAGKIVAEFLVAERVPAILDVSGFGEAEMRRFVAEFAATFYRLNREPVHWFVDEADEFAPQSGYTAEGAKCLGAMQNIVRRGRARGIGVTLITQRSAVLNKSVLTQTECLIALQTTAPHDLKAIDEWVKYHGTEAERHEIMRALPTLQQGEAFVYSPGWLRTLQRIKVRKRRTHDSSATPKPGEKRSEPRTLADVNLPALETKMASAVADAKANDPKLLRARIAELERAAKSPPAVKDPAAVPDTRAIERAVATAIAERDRHWKSEVAKLEKAVRDRTGRLAKIEAIAHLNGEAEVAIVVPPIITREGSSIAESRRNITETPRNIAKRAASITAAPADDRLRPAHQRLLDALAWLATMGIDRPARNIVAAVAGVSPKSSSFANDVSRLSSLGLVHYPANGAMALTPEGEAIANAPASPPTVEELHAAWRNCPALRPAHVRLLDAVIAAYPDELTRESLAEQAGVSPASSSFANDVSRLSSLGLIRYPGSGRVVGTDLLFPVGVR